MKLQKDNAPDTVKRRKAGNRKLEMNKRNFTVEYKTKIVLQILSGEEKIGSLALLHQISPNQLRTWKAQFLEKALLAFECKRQKGSFQ